MIFPPTSFAIRWRRSRPSSSTAGRAGRSSNHDVKRVLSRWGGDSPTPELAKLLTVLVASLRGLGMRLSGRGIGTAGGRTCLPPVERPVRHRVLAEFQGSRRMPHAVAVGDSDSAGFSRTAPWLPIPERHRALAVSLQESDVNSVLNGFRAFMRLAQRAGRAALGRYSVPRCFRTAACIRTHV